MYGWKILKKVDKEKYKNSWWVPRKENITHMVREKKSYSFYYWCCNFPLEQSQKQEDIN